MPQNFDSDNPALDDSTLDVPVLSYRDRLNHWAVVRLLPATPKNTVQKNIVARFRSRSDAEGHLRFLRHNMPEGDFLVSFDNRKNIEGVSG
jgi:hypothetical protein